jgi:SAM-dependent methyltransferase
VAGRAILEVGSIAAEGTAQGRVRERNPRIYIGTDIAKGPGVDEVCAAENLVPRFGPEVFDVVLATEVVEHIRDWRAAFLNMIGVLKVGGLLVVTTRSIGYPYHGVPHDYWRYELEDIRQILAGWNFVALERDPERPGVFAAARKPSAVVSRLDDIALHAMAIGQRTRDVSTAQVLVHRVRSPRRLAAWLLPEAVKAPLRKFLTPLGYSTDYRGPKGAG